MDRLYSQTTDWMDEQLFALSLLVPPPKVVRLNGGTAPRYTEKSAHQALIQKLARTISGLRAATLVLAAGFLQEQAALCRMIFEFEEDITFLALASRQSPTPNLLVRYLQAFFAEESAVSALNAGQPVKGRNLIGRKDIANFIANNLPGVTDSYTASNTGQALGHTFSGYIHGASDHIMEMFDVQSRRFVTTAWPQHPLRADHEHDIWNYFYRGILSIQLAAWAIGDQNSMNAAEVYLNFFKEQSGDRLDF